MSRAQKHPSLSDFYHDMNKHGAATYRKVGTAYVVEVDTRPGGYWLTVWKAVEHPTEGGYVAPMIDGNRYAWDAKGRKEYDDRDAAERRAKDFGGSEKAVQAWCGEHPYNGPRTPYNERVQQSG